MMRTTNKWILSVFCFFLACVTFTNVSAQQTATLGNEFYVIFATNYDSQNVCEVRYVVTNSCYITAQYYDGTYLDNNQLYQPGVYTQIVDKTKAYVTAGPGIKNLGLKITSTQNIGVYAINMQANTSDATCILPVTALGADYAIVSGDGTTPSICVMATQPGTTFTIRNPSGVAVVTNQALLERQGYVYESSADLTGYTVEANSHVAVWSSINCGSQVSCGACDHVYEQMWPRNTAGKNYFVWTLGTVGCGDQIKILGTEDNTSVSINVGGVVTPVTLNKGTTHTFMLNGASPYTNGSNLPAKITADKPVIVRDMLGTAPALMWIAPIEQRVTSTIVSPFVPTGTSVITNHILSVLIPAGAVSNMTMRETRSGVTTNETLTFYTNTTDPNFVIATKMYTAQDNVEIELTNPAGLTAYMTGWGNNAWESYGYSAGAGAFNLQSYFTIQTKTTPYNDTYYSETEQAIHTFESTDDISIKRTVEKSFTSVSWLVNNTPYSVSENSLVNNAWSLPASSLNPGQNTITMKVRYAGANADSLYVGNVWKFDGQPSGPTCSIFADDVWFFGATPNCTGKSDGIIFNNDGQGGKVAVNGSGISKVCSWENSLSVSAPGCNGSLIFYSQHNNLYNAKHQPMKNGAFSGHTSVADGLAACYIGNNKYMLFAVNAAYESGGGLNALGLDCHIVDMAGDGGLGEKISSTNIEPNGVSESIELIPVAGTTNDYWLVYRMQASTEMRIRKISGGVVSGVLSTLSLAAYETSVVITYSLKANKTFTMLGMVYPSTASVLFFNFNNTTGVISIKDYAIPPALGGAVYGFEFSPDSRFAYAAAYDLATSKISQYDIAAKTWTTPFEYGGLGSGMKAGPDGRIYVMRYGRYLGVIPNPNQPLTPASYIKDGFDLGAGTEGNTGLALSTGLTAPAVCPSGANTAPTAIADNASYCDGGQSCVAVTLNDTDPNPGDTIRLTGAYFVDPNDTNRLELIINTQESTVCIKAKANATFTSEETIEITYSIQDNGTDPVPQCAEGTLTFTVVVSNYTPVLKSKEYIACPNALVNLEILPEAGYTYAWYDAAVGGNLLGTGTSYTLTKDNSAVQSVWIESIPTSGTICKRTRADVILSSYCGGTTPTGCSETGSLIYKEDFKGNSASNPLVSPTDLIGGRSDLVFNGVNPGSGNYGLIKYTNYNWALYNDDHTYPNDRTQGYFMYIDPAPNQMNATLYEYDILNLCSGTSNMSFTVWMVDLQTGAARPKIEMLILDKNTGDTLVTSGTFMIPRQLGSGQTAGNPAIWRQYGFNFSLPTGVSDITFRLTNKEVDDIGNDWAIDDIEIRFCAPPVALSGQFRYCAGENMNITANYTDDGTFGGSQETRWLYSATGDLTSFSSWSEVATGAVINKTLVTGYYRAVVGLQDNLDNKRYNCCAFSDAVWVSIVPPVMYWNAGTSANSNWNDPANWADIAGKPLNMVPLSCTDVHIPGNAYHYPSLDPTVTIRNASYGEPECRDITFHWGGEVAKPHYLSYRKAYILYNLGYYDSNNAYKIDGDVFSAYPIQRGRWYMLAAPLKKIASGDFSVGGYPNMWQRSFKTSPDLTPGHGGALDLTGEWYVPENNNALEIGAKQNYGVAIWAGEYLPGVIGEDDHTKLNALRGIVQMPYFEDAAISSAHRIHQYNSSALTSSFSYYYSNRPTLPIEPGVAPGTIVRADEAYRFVFEDSNNEPQEDFKVTVKAGDEVMVGNVFLSSLDFNNFYTRNQTVISNYYRLYVNNAWQQYNTSSGGSLPKEIAPFQSFVVKTVNDAGGTVDLYFPKSSSVTRPDNTPHQLKVSGGNSLPDNVIYLKASNEDGESWTTIGVNVHPGEENIQQMFVNDPYNKVRVPQLYTLGKDGQKNTAQYAFGNSIEIPLGIKSDTMSVVTMSIVNWENLNAESLVLVDTRRNKEIDLLSQNEYRFTYEPEQGERFILRIGDARNPTGIETNEVLDVLKVYVSGHTLNVSSAVGLSEVTVGTAQGLKVHSVHSLDQTYYCHELEVPAGMYLVTVRLSNGEVKTTKVIVK